MARMFSHTRRVKVGLCRLCFIVLVVSALLHLHNRILYAVSSEQVSKHSTISHAVENQAGIIQGDALLANAEPLLSQDETAVLPPIDSGVLIVPSLGLVEPIRRVLVRDGFWDISTLHASVGHLQTTGEYPGDDLAMTFVGHTTIPPRTGPFANLYRLRHGERVIYRWNGTDFIYEVSQILEVVPTQVSALYESNGAMLMLVTCSGWNGETAEYKTRLVTRAVLVDQRSTTAPAFLPRFNSTAPSEPIWSNPLFSPV